MPPPPVAFPAVSAAWHLHSGQIAWNPVFMWPLFSSSHWIKLYADIFIVGTVDEYGVHCFTALVRNSFHLFWVSEMALFVAWFVDLGLPWWLSGKESTCNAGDLGWIPGSRRSPGEGNGNPLQYSCLENPKDRRLRWGTAQKVAKSQTWLKDQHFHFWLLPDCGFPSSWPEGEPLSLYLVIGGKLFLHWFWL